MIKDCVWFAMFGINILSFITLQETLLSFLNHTLIFVVLTVNYLLFKLIFYKGNTFAKVLMYVIIIGTSVLYFFLFKKPVSLLTIFIYTAMIFSYFMNKKYGLVLIFSLIFLIGFSTIEPLTQGLIKRRVERLKSSTQFTWNESNTDYYSFTYENKVIDTQLERYFLVGNTKAYFFIYDRDIEKTLIISKGDCKNIQARFKILTT